MKIFTIVFLVMLFSSEVFATADGPDYFSIRKQVKKGVTLRKSFSVSAKKLSTIPVTAKHLKNLGCIRIKDGVALKTTDMPIGELWCQIKFGKDVGWVQSKYLSEDE